jgi:hypothetical protein
MQRSWSGVGRTGRQPAAQGLRWQCLCDAWPNVCAKRVQVVWVVRHGEIGDAFFDLDAAQFLLARLTHWRGAAGDAAAGSFDAGGGCKPERAGPRPRAPEQAAPPAPGAAQDAADAARGERPSGGAGARGGGGNADAQAPMVLSGRAAGPAAACMEAFTAHA